MKIVISGSSRVWDKLKELESNLSERGFDVTAPTDTNDIDFDNLSFEEHVELEHTLMTDYFEAIKNSDAVIIANFDTAKGKNYIGTATFLEMCCAYAYGKKIFVLQNLPREQANALEIAAFKPVFLKGELSLISQ